jgi:ribosomal protein L11 methylase PrmA
MVLLISLGLQLISFAILAVIMFILLRSIWNGAIYFPTTPENVAAILAVLKVKPGEKVADLGSGDGRIVIALTKAGAEAHGYETNPILVYTSRKAIKKAGLEGKAFIHYQSFWRADLSKFDAIVVYGFPNFFEKLAAKIKKEMRPGSRIASNLFEFPGWGATEKTEERVYLYIL